LFYIEILDTLKFVLIGTKFTVEGGFLHQSRLLLKLVLSLEVVPSVAVSVGSPSVVSVDSSVTADSSTIAVTTITTVVIVATIAASVAVSVVPSVVASGVTTVGTHCLVLFLSDLLVLGLCLDSRFVQELFIRHGLKTFIETEALGHALFGEFAIVGLVEASLFGAEVV